MDPGPARRPRLRLGPGAGFSIEADPVAIADSAKGHRIAVPAVVTGVVALAGRRRGWALAVDCVAAAAAVVAVLLTVLLPGGEY